MAAGAHGCISVVSNIAPRLCADLHNAWQKGDLKKVQELNDRLVPVHDAMFVESSPGPVKYAAELLGLSTADMRLPLCEIAESSKAAVKSALTGAGLLK